jgi:hypothetical protein
VQQSRNKDATGRNICRRRGEQEGRNPKSEGRSHSHWRGRRLPGGTGGPSSNSRFGNSSLRSEGRNPNPEARIGELAGRPAPGASVSGFGFRPSFGLRPSDFGTGPPANPQNENWWGSRVQRCDDAENAEWFGLAGKCERTRMSEPPYVGCYKFLNRPCAGTPNISCGLNGGSLAVFFGGADRGRRREAVGQKVGLADWYWVAPCLDGGCGLRRLKRSK